MGVGIDIVEVDKIRRLTERWDKKFLTRIFTDRELEEWKSSGSRMLYLAGRFATKEAFIKASPSHVSKWKDIEVIGGKFTHPVIRFKGKELKRASLSISHTQSLAIAVVITH